MTNPSPRSKKSSSSRIRRHDAQRPNEFKLFLANLAEALDYRTYRLGKRSQQFDVHDTLILAKVVKQFQSQLKEMEYDEAYS